MSPPPRIFSAAFLLVIDLKIKLTQRFASFSGLVNRNPQQPTGA